jgi:hypothetical protein
LAAFPLGWRYAVTAVIAAAIHEIIALVLAESDLQLVMLRMPMIFALFGADAWMFSGIGP